MLSRRFPELRSIVRNQQVIRPAERPQHSASIPYDIETPSTKAREYIDASRPGVARSQILAMLCRATSTIYPPPARQMTGKSS
jgi:hypothetical protein